MDQFNANANVKRKHQLASTKHFSMLFLYTGIEITELKDDREVTKQGARHFCYLNNIKPSWRESWTRIQVGSNVETGLFSSSQFDY